MTDKKSSNSWNVTKILGLVLIIAGGIVAIFFGYMGLSFRHGGGSFSRPTGGFVANHTFNQSNYTTNQTRFNATRRAAGFVVTRFLSTYIEGVIIGALLLLLGFVTFKYGSLQTSSRIRK